MKNVFTGLLALMIVMLSSCTKDRISGSGSVVTDDRAVSNFTAVSNNGSSGVTVTKGNTFKVQVKGYSNLLPYFDTKVINGTLELGFRNHVNVRNDNIEVMVTMPELTGLRIAGSGNIATNGNFTGINNLDAEISGSGNITIEQGDAKNFSGRIAGSGDIHAFGLTADKANVHISGSGNTRITAKDQLTVKIAGSGNVYYKGSPNVSINISGSGGVSKQ